MYLLLFVCAGNNVNAMLASRLERHLLCCMKVHAAVVILAMWCCCSIKLLVQ